MNKFGTKDRSETLVVPDDRTSSSSPTLAIVTLNYAIRGDSTRMDKISTRDNVRDALTKLSADASVEDAIVAAEVMWSPEDENDTLEPEVAYADFPQLVPLV